MLLRHAPAGLVLPLTLIAPVAAGAAVPPAPGGAPSAASVAVAATPLRGGDVSWPQCPRGMGVPGRRTLGLPMPTRKARFVIVGLTNGRAFTRNPCLASQLSWVARRSLPVAGYTMLSYPTSAELKKYAASGPYTTATLTGRLRNYGYAQTRYALANAARAGLAAPLVWVDVEPRAERPWSSRTARNRAVITGALRAIRARHLRAGIYSYAYAWRTLTGSWQLDLPLWMPSGSHASTWAKRRSAALAACRRTSFTGGALVMTQWVWNNRDYDIACPPLRDPADWFAVPGA